MNICDSNSDIISHVPGNRKYLSVFAYTRCSEDKSFIKEMEIRVLPQLVFDKKFYRDLHRTTHAKLLMIIYQVLLLHRGPIIKFTLSLSGLECCSEIDQLILFVSSNDIQGFTLCIWKGGLFKLPSSLYSCSQLKHLNLRSCMLKPPPGFEGFSRLLSLHLHEVVIADDVLSILISRCPLLEDLTVFSSTGLDSLEVVGPNLKSICFEAHVRSICFKNTSHLENVSIYLTREGNELEISSSVVLLDGVTEIEFLELDFCYVKALPNKTSAIPIVQDFVEVHVCSDVSLNQLRKVDTKKVSGTKPELEFIKLLLAKSSMLETMLIELNSEDVNELRIVKELTRFRRASPLAEMKFVN